MEAKKIICITLGINETKVLKFLNNNKWFTFDEIHNQFKDVNASLKYPKQLGPLLLRLLRKNLINRCETIDSYYYKINEKGKLMLEVIKK